MTERISVTCGEKLYKFKLGSSARSVLDTLARMHPPRGCLQHVDDDDALVALSQEQLSQNNYTYCPGQATYRPGQATEDVVNKCVMDAVHRLQLKKGKEFETCGTAVVCSPTGLCVTADHCLNDLPRRPKLFVGGLPAKICARSGKKKDIAALKVDGNNEFQFIPLDGTLLMRETMKVHLISYPVMVDTDFAVVGPTVTHGAVVNSWTPNLMGADYSSFSNSSGGAVVHKNKLVGIHLETFWQDDGQIKGETGIEGKVAYLEKNMGNKGCLSNFVNAATICTFLDDHNLLAIPTFGTLSSASCSRQAKQACRLVRTPQ